MVLENPPTASWMISESLLVEFLKTTVSQENWTFSVFTNSG